MKKVKLYDTTLRDGSQGEGISYSVQDKVAIAKKLDLLGIHYIEGGWPGSNPKDMEFFKKLKDIKFKNSKLVAFGSTRRANIKAQDDDNIQAFLSAGTDIVALFGKSWDMHVTEVLKTNLEENLLMIEDSIKYLSKNGVTVFFDAEHFFDGYAANPKYALNVLKAAERAGAKALILCDTNGGTITSRLKEVVAIVVNQVKAEVGIHVHNDMDMAVANSVAAVEAGCAQVQGTINGYGERCGNANLVSIIPALKLKLGIDCIFDTKLKELTEVSRYVAEISNMRQMANQPYTGASAFAHKAGVHVNAVMKNSASYEHIRPERVGNKRRFLVSELSGKSTILALAKSLNFDLSKDTPQTKKILNQIQDLEYQGYHFEAAEASFKLLMERSLGRHRKAFELLGFKVIVEHRGDRLVSDATIKIKVRGEVEHTIAEGDGPINALDKAIRKALISFYPALNEMHLADFKVRVIDEKMGTAAKVRVLIQSQDEKDSWWTIGVSENIIEAAWHALTDSVEYKLLKDKKKYN